MSTDHTLAQPEPQGPSDEDLLELMPETMRDEFSYAAKVCSDATGGQVKPGIFRVCLNRTALEYARAAIAADRARWGRPAVDPVPVSERPWEREGWCDPSGRCWWWNPATNTLGTPWWSHSPWEWVEDATYSLPHYALPVPQQQP